MQIRDAVVRAARSALQTVVAIELVVRAIQAALPSGLKVKGVDIGQVTSGAFAVLAAVAVALTSFAQNLAEDNTSFQLPK